MMEPNFKSRPLFQRGEDRKSGIEAAKRRLDAYIKVAVWVYFLLLIFEGAVRKWGPPELATPFLVIRDPIALVALMLAFARGSLPMDKYLVGIVTIGTLGFILSIVVGHGNPLVAAFGARIFLLHFPLMFVIGRTLHFTDVLSMGKATMYIALPMTILIGYQFYSPQSAWVNRGLAGDLDGAGFSGALGFYRPPGTFSFTTGTTSFYSFLAPFVFYFWIKSERIPKVLLIGASAALLAAVPLSISRSLFFQIGITIIFLLLGIVRNPIYAKRILFAGFFVWMAVAALSTTPVLDKAIEVLRVRFENASAIEGGFEGTLVDRFFGGLSGAVANAGEQPLFGHGIGMGTNVGAALLSGDRTFLIAEGEWSRNVGELGPILGLAVIVLRVSLILKLAFASFKSLPTGNFLSWLLLSATFLPVAIGNWAQPTSLGFSTLVGGLMIASLKPVAKETEVL